jgi:hypothetical protein
MTLGADDRFGWLRPAAASVVAGLLSGIGSFYVAARPAVDAVQEQSINTDKILCQAENRTREVLRRLALGLLQPEEVPEGASLELTQYIMARNDRRERSRFLAEDATRGINCDGELL